MQQMGPTGTPPSRVHPDQIILALAPVVEEGIHSADAGVPLRSALKEAALAGFLAGRGMPPAGALELVQQWRLSGVARELARTPRGESPTRPRTEALTRATMELPPFEREALRPVLESDMKNEATAARFYQELLEQATDPTVREFLEHAIADEQTHYRMLGELYREVTGHTYEAQPETVEFASLRAGLLQALRDELKAAEDYRDSYLRYRTPRIRDVFFELMTDELEHATRFTYALSVVS